MQYQSTTRLRAAQIEAGNNALIEEAVRNVFTGATRNSTKFLYPRGTVNVYRAERKIRVMINTGHSYSTGTVSKDGTVKWDDDTPSRKAPVKLRVR